MTVRTWPSWPCDEAEARACNIATAGGRLWLSDLAFFVLRKPPECERDTFTNSSIPARSSILSETRRRLPSPSIAERARASPSIADPFRMRVWYIFEFQNASAPVLPSVRPPVRSSTCPPARAPVLNPQENSLTSSDMTPSDLQAHIPNLQSACLQIVRGQALTAKQPQYGRPLAEPCWTSPNAYLPPLPLPLLLLPPTAGYCHHHHHCHCCYYQSLRGCLT